MSMIIQGLALACTYWSFQVAVVQFIGILKLFRSHSAPPPDPVSPRLPDDEVPHITVIRPVKGLDKGLYDCLASTFRQSYPRHKLTIYLCVPSTSDPAYPTLKKVVSDFPAFDAKIMIEEEDPLLHGPQGNVDNLGPNPKIRNMSRAYREAKGEVIWIIDCNVWVSKGVAGRMVDKLYGFQPGGRRVKPYKFVHQLPLVVDTDATAPTGPTSGNEGGRLDEMFMATTHAKFYSAINTVGIAPCIVGKSNMFRREHLDRMTDPSQNPILTAADASRRRGIDFFSSYICEDHLIGDLLWRSRVPGHRNHGLVAGDLAIQPISDMSTGEYIARRVRWLRVRKYTVLLATLVEPGVESLLCSLYLSFGLTTLSWFHDTLGVSQTWSSMALIWVSAVTTWMLVDRWVFNKIHACQSVEADVDMPAFARGTERPGGPMTRPFGQWLYSWIGREVLALPIWTTAVLMGTTVNWRGKRFKVRVDMSVVEMDSPKGGKSK
ncbi:glycosyltransferase family 21 protein [Thozetella sp. PMI_491]|nr:glycosyltransferase family 21 protein [Thozetella sp. PMI_491]